MIIIAVEGQSDRGVVRAITEKIGNPKITFILMRGNRPDKVARSISSKAYQYMKKKEPVDKIIVLKDLHGRREEEVEKHLEQIGNKIKRIAPYHGIIIRHAIEAWILSDVSCLKESLGIVARQVDPESIVKPDDYLDSLFTKKNMRYYKNEKLLYNIAKNIDIAVAKRNSRCFLEFIEAVKDP